MFVYNAKLINANDISLSINSMSLNYGFSLFETVKLFNSKGQMLNEHINRLNNSLKCLNIDHKLEINSIKASIEELICALEVENGAIKIMVVEDEGSFNTLISYSARIYKEKLYRLGYKITLSSFKSNESAPLTYHKTSNYGHNILALRDARTRGFDEAIFENSKGFISEGSLSNIFLVKDNIVYTPNIESGILNGLMRSLLISSLRVLDIELVEK